MADGRKDDTMNQAGTPTPRRTLLQRGLALLGGALGVGAAGGEVHARSQASDTARTFQLVGRGHGSGRLAKGARAASRHVVLSGDLLDAPDGSAVGSFHTNGFLRETSLGSPLPADSNIAFQTFALAEGTLFGLGPGPQPGGERACAILGGTGRYAGAHGTYVERALSTGRGRQAVEFTFTLSA
jgi:hypothetical protein